MNNTEKAKRFVRLFEEQLIGPVHDQTKAGAQSILIGSRSAGIGQAREVVAKGTDKASCHINPCSARNVIVKAVKVAPRTGRYFQAQPLDRASPAARMSATSSSAFA